MNKNRALFVGLWPLVMLAFNLHFSLWIMLALGVLHSYWPVIPAFGYWETYLVVTGIYFTRSLATRIKYPESLDKAGAKK